VVKKSFYNFWKGKKVFITGHTGFKGSWLIFLLKKLGATVSGYSLKPRKKDLIFLKSNFKKSCLNFYGDIRDIRKLEKAILRSKPEILIHMAAQSLVLPSYEKSLETFEVNFNGTLNILELIKKLKIKSSVIVTTDKVYLNKNKKIKHFQEKDPLGGSDPYSVSKVSAEHLVECYNKNFFINKKINVVSARAGNVIGGGDRSEFRVIPDYFRSVEKNKPMIIRFPNAIRPWQHVLDPLFGYLLLAKMCYEKKRIPSYSWNFSQNDNNSVTVKQLVSRLNKFFRIKVKINSSKNNLKEKRFLNLSSKISKKYLKWSATYNTEETIKKIFEWENFFKKNKSVNFICDKQVADYLSIIK
jgi:CDP-glucose 4,6-dehydratase